MWGFAGVLRRLGQDLGFVQIVVWGCGILYAAMLLIDPSGIRTGGFLSLLSPSQGSLFLFGASGAYPVFFMGRWWTLLSAGWLHGGVLHILFNMMWVRQLAPVTAMEYGVGRMVIIYTMSSITGFLASTLAGGFLAFLPWPLRGAYFTIGASAAIFGLLGALVYSGQRGGSSMVGRQAMGFAVILGLFGLVFPGIDNWAHGGGFAGGYFIARWLDPMQPERTDHLFVALACLLLSALSILISILHGLQFF